MTVEVNRHVVKLGWETATAIIIFLVVTMFGAGAFTTKYMNKQDEIYIIVKQLVPQVQKNTSDIIDLKRKSDSLANIQEQCFVPAKNTMRYFKERRINGKLVLIPTNDSEMN